MTVSKYKWCVALVLVGSLIGWFHLQLWRIVHTPVSSLSTGELVLTILISTQGWRVIEDFLNSKKQK